MIKSKTKMSTLLVTILTILTILLGGLFVSNAINNTNAPVDSTVRAAGPRDTGDVDNDGNIDWEFYESYDNKENVLIIKNKDIVESDYSSDEDSLLDVICNDADTGGNYFNVVILDCGDELTKIGAYAFAGYEWVTEFYVPEGVEYIGQGAFYRIGWECKVFLPNSLDEIESGSFNFDGDGDGCVLCYNGTESEWNSVTGSSSYIRKKYDGTLDDFNDESYIDYSERYILFLQTETQEPESDPVDPGQGSGSGEQGQGGQGGQDAPATGVELNIGIAVLSLALVSAMFVIVRRKEER